MKMMEMRVMKMTTRRQSGIFLMEVATADSSYQILKMKRNTRAMMAWMMKIERSKNLSKVLTTTTTNC